MALSGVDGGAAMAPTRAVVDLDVTYAAALPDPRFRRLVGPGGVGLNVNPLGEATFLWVKSGASEASDDAGCAAPPEGALGDVMLVDPDTGGVPAGYRVHPKNLSHSLAGASQQRLALGPLSAARAHLENDSLPPLLRVAVVPAGPDGPELDRRRVGV
ncbi:hypothetical protein FNF31_00027 [Cafeteria roenbergensis]|uniref:Uncharacterized protein n=1 Tax=Cafeteria roenbergensis TaxID=33653 RepID=A0A5A8DTS5_CAFRO|nr:hypothetical protein FNF31_00027 [Cafeteria roenbergensis]